jgi:hypothetical protein
MLQSTRKNGRPRLGAITTPTHCMEALRRIAANASLHATDRLLAAEQAITNYSRSGANSIEQRRMLIALDGEIAREASERDYLWFEMREFVVQVLNQLPG